MPVRAAWRRWLRPLTQGLCLALFLGLFFGLAWPYAGHIHADHFAQRDWLPLELFLWLDPLAGIAAALAARSWSNALLGAVAVGAVSVFLPRAFCGYVCPLGTLQDVFDWLIGRRIHRFRVRRMGAGRHLRFYLLAAVLMAAALGVMLAGFVAAIPVLTRGLMFSAGLAQVGFLRNWGLVGPFTVALGISLALFALVFLLGLFAPRFWCRYVCPSGALISLPSLLGLNRRQVTAACTECGHCVTVCPFDAIQDDIRTRPLDCAFCQTCVNACPTGAIHFAGRVYAGSEPNLPAPAVSVEEGQAPAGNTACAATMLPVSRRGWLAAVAGGAASAAAVRVAGAPRQALVRPPGSVAEERFLDLCVRCGECFKVCPGSALQPAGFAEGLESLWTPILTPTQAGCHQDCNFCTLVCPTGAIVPLTLEAKRKFHVGLARIDTQLCLPHRGERDCQACFEECEAAGYHAIEMRPVKLSIGEVPDAAVAPEELEQMASIRAPFILADACVGCGLCEYRCHTALHRQQRLLPRSAIVVRGVSPH